MSFNLWGLEIYYYGIIIAGGILAAFVTGLLIFKKLKYNENVLFLVLLLCIPCAIVGARVLYVLCNLSQYHSFLDVINIRLGGLSIYGGVIAGAIGLFAIARIKKCGFFTLADIIVICLILAQCIGRWGNFTNSEVYGFAVGQHIFPFTVDIGGTPHLATFFYESVLNLIGFCLLLWIFFKKQKKWGITSACYLIWYGVVRAILEPLREAEYILKFYGDNPIVFNQVSFMISIVMIILGMLLLWAVKRGWISQKSATLLKETKECSNKKKTGTKEAK